MTNITQNSSFSANIESQDRVCRPLAEIEKLRYIKEQIDEAGEKIRSGLFVPEYPMPSFFSKLAGWDSKEHDSIRDIVNNWRAAHNFPMKLCYLSLVEWSALTNSKALIAARLKRFSTIVHKLQRPKLRKKFTLTTMQDIGGCRIVVDTIEELNDFVRRLRKNKIGSSMLIGENNYIETPKKNSGYRSHHFIFAFKNEKTKYENLSGLKTEIQLRTRLQHLWATAVETIDQINQMSLKTGFGSPLWNKFFLLMSGFIAIKENLPNVLGISINLQDLKKEIYTLHEELNLEQLLHFAPLVLRNLSQKVDEDVELYLISLSKNQNLATASPYKSSQIQEALETYYTQEAQPVNEQNTVLIRARSLKQLEELYPNYHLDIRAFYDLVVEAIL